MVDFALKMVDFALTMVDFVFQNTELNSNCQVICLDSDDNVPITNATMADENVGK